MHTAFAHDHPDSPASFAFSEENAPKAREIIARYPAGRQQSAVMPLLALAQNQAGGWLPRVAMDYVAEMLGMPPVRVYEVASFYTMYNLAPVGKHVIEVCTTTPCWLKGSDAILAAAQKRLGIAPGGTTRDGMFSLREVECLGACVNAPMCSVASHNGATLGGPFYEDLTPESITKIIDDLAAGKTPKPGPQSGRKSSEPANNANAHGKGDAPGAPMFGVNAKTESDTAKANAPGKHPEGEKRYSADQQDKK